MTHNVQYWIDYWKSLFSGIEHATFALSLISPRVLLRELIEEIETRGLKNQDNKNFLYGQIKAYFKSDPPTQKCLLPILTLICHEFEKPRLELLDQLCRRGLSTIDSLQYFDCAVDILTEKLVADSPVHRDALALICQDLIVELLEVGYSQKTIENIPRDVFSNILEGNGQVHTNFFHEIEYPKDDSDEQAKAAYHAQLKSYMSALTDRDRIQALKRYPRKPPSQFLFIFQIRGLRGKENFDIGPVHFYSPSEKEMLKHNDGKDMEMFGTSDAHVYMNAATKVNTVDSNAGAEIGRQRIIDALNCLRFGFNSKSQFEVGRDYLIVDDEGTLKGFSSGLDKRSGILHWIESLNVDHKTVRTINDAELFQQVFPNQIGRAHV